MKIKQLSQSAQKFFQLQGFNINHSIEAPHKSTKETPLICAIVNNKNEIVKELIAAKVDIHALDKKGYAPITAASIVGNVEALSLLLKCDPNLIHFTTNGATLLMLAVSLVTEDESRILETVKFLVNNGINIHATNPADKYTALSAAAQNGHCQVVQYLLAQKADVNHRSLNGLTPLMCAMGKKEGVDHFSKVIEVLLLHPKIGIEIADLNGYTPLICAASEGHEDLVDTLIAKNANVNAKDIYNQTALFLASSKGHLNIVKALVNAKAEVNLVAKGGFSILGIASFKGHHKIAKYLTKHGASLEKGTQSAVFNSGLDFLQSMMAAGGTQQILQVLEDAKISRTVETTSVLEAARLGDKIKESIDKSKESTDESKENTEESNVSKPSAIGSAEATIQKQLTLQLCIAASKNNLEDIRSLLKSGAEINALRESTGKSASPLHYACHAGQFEAAELLLQLKADPTLPSSAGKTPYDKVRKDLKAKFAPLFGMIIENEEEVAFEIIDENHNENALSQ